MVKIKKMNQATYASFLREIKVAGELIRTRQEEKEGLLTEFDAESKRYFFGKISEKALAASVKKTNTELNRLDKEIRQAIARAKAVAHKVTELTTGQVPLRYKATLTGISGGETVKSKKRKPAKRKAVRRKPVRRKPARRAVKKRPVRRRGR